MKTDPHQQPALESYATFWEPLSSETLVTAPSGGSTTTDSTEAKDAYLEFMNVTEGVPSTQPVKTP